MIFIKGNIITNSDRVLELLKVFNEPKQNLLLTYFNQHCYNLYTNTPEYKYIIDEKFNTYLDGIGVFLALKFLNFQDVQKFNASDLNEKILEYLIETKRKIYLIGGNFIEEDVKNFEKRGLNVCGYQHGYFTIEKEEEILINVQKTNPDVIIVGMGVPRQEIFSAKLNDYLENKKIICVGNFLEFYIGKVKRIPKPLRNIGVEWLFRLITEPRRLWNRYILGIPKFIFLILSIRLKYTSK